MKYNSSIKINDKIIDKNSPTYFIADIAANHDGDLERAKKLIHLAKEAGADAIKFQHFLANKIVSDYGFKHNNINSSHQSDWKKSVYEIYSDYECNRSWSEELSSIAKSVGIDFLTTPYDFDAVDELEKYICAYKIGSGDITWTSLIEYIAHKKKPILLATGASNMADVERAIESIIKYNKAIVLMQCNTNYTAERKNFKHVNLNVLKTYATKYPEILLGLSDHTKTLSTVLGAVSLGAKFIEKHFTDDDKRTGPDHNFSITPTEWRLMVERTRELENSFGTGIKIVEDNELETVVLQRRAVRVKYDLSAGHIIKNDDIEYLRPAPLNSVSPYDAYKIIGKKLRVNKVYGDVLYIDDIEE